MTARLEIIAKPGSRLAGIARRGSDLIVAVRERAVDGRANDAIVRAIASWLGIAPSRIRIVHGAGGRRKVLELDGLDAATLHEQVRRLTEDAR